MHLSYQQLLTVVLYALVPILTWGIEDEYLIEVIGYDPSVWHWRLAHSGVTALDIAGVVLLVLTLPVISWRRNRAEWPIFLIFGVAILASGVYGTLRGATLGRTMFEPSAWKTLVPLAAFTFALNAVLDREAAVRRFLGWFCLNQAVLAVVALTLYLFARAGHPTYFGESVPIFAGDMLVLMNCAFAASFFRYLAARRLRDGALTLLFATIVLFSLRRTFIAALVSVILVYGGVTVLRNRASLRSLTRATAIALLGILGLWVFAGFIGPLRLAPDVVLGRLLSVNLAWALGQGDPIYGTTGHVDDLLDGLETVLANPVLGQGLNVWFPLPRTASWQEGSVHAGLFQVWIKFGLLGVLGYLALFSRGLRCLVRWNDRDGNADLRLFVGWFSVHFLLVSVLMNSVLFGYKNSLMTAIYASLSTLLLHSHVGLEQVVPATGGRRSVAVASR